MIAAIEITTISVILAVAYQIVIRPGELLQSWARFVNLNMTSELIKKLLLCPYCLGGQIALWLSLYYIYSGHSIGCIMSVPASIIIIYFVVKNHFKSYDT